MFCLPTQALQTWLWLEYPTNNGEKELQQLLWLKMVLRLIKKRSRNSLRLLRSSRVPQLMVVWDELPYNETGKLLRRVVREELSK